MRKVIGGSVLALAMMALATTSLTQTTPSPQRTPMPGGIVTMTPMPTFTPIGGEPTGTPAAMESPTPTPTPLPR